MRALAPMRKKEPHRNDDASFAHGLQSVQPGHTGQRIVVVHDETMPDGSQRRQPGEGGETRVGLQVQLAADALQLRQTG